VLKKINGSVFEAAALYKVILTSMNRVVGQTEPIRGKW
jgi:hypothetical protein